jgi:hypothetical protein
VLVVVAIHASACCAALKLNANVGDCQRLLKSELVRIQRLAKNCAL